MCEYFEKEPQIKIAEKDIVAYKVVRSRLSDIFYKSTIQGTIYLKNKLYKTKIGIIPRSNEFYESTTGFYSYTNIEDLYIQDYPLELYNEVPVKVIIPDGSEYILSMNNAVIISNQIKIIGIYSEKNLK